MAEIRARALIELAWAERTEAPFAPSSRDRAPAATIVARGILSIVNEGARLLDEEIALRGSDVDLVQVKGYGFPPGLGGPPYLADAIGLGRIRSQTAAIARRTGQDPAIWAPAPLIERLHRQGGRLSGYSTE